MPMATRGDDLFPLDAQQEVDSQCFFLGILCMVLLEDLEK